LLHMRKNPWTILSEKGIYENKWIRLTEYNVLNPGGGKGIYGKVHFKNRAIGVVVLDELLNTYLVGQYRFTLDMYTWEIPEGGGSFEEDPLVAAQRELLEETGIVADRWEKILDFHLSNSVCDECGQVFLATGLHYNNPEPEETEQLEIRKMPFEEAYQMVVKGEITDSLAVAGILRTKLLLQERSLI
jgi:8-oxo-dGTP pyrophosphatase MutT (NUDIX family)